ncbi:Ferrous iron transport protein B [Serratia plymuthica]|uniref:Ferrous iron transport protein B n=1 Tax=Serratia plymuthica TaxID=82996 RepID=A0A2X4V253_SERPL|nr:Ferrous iron transport protein B [Serratia plymuthica]
MAYSLATLFYQIATFSQHPRYSLTAIAIVALFNLLILFCLRRARSRVTVRLGKATPAACCQGAQGNCH